MKKLNKIALATTLAFSSLAAPLAAQAELSGNLGVFSQYVLRGITNAPEDGSVALQGGFDWGHESGVYAGYWGSSLGYSDSDGDGFENDFYGGYAGEFGSIGYDVGLIYYYYVNIDDADAAELSASMSFGPVSVGLKYLTEDVVWGNQGDIYWTASYETDLPADFGFGATLGYYTYQDSGDYIASSASDGGFRHLDLTLSHPIGNTGADMSLTYIIGGEDRNEVDQDNAIVLGLSYGFDI